MKELWDVYDENRHRTGKIIERGEEMREDEYHLVVQAWVKNKRGEWFITKRSDNKSFPLRWEAPGGSVLSGETSEQGVLREVKEETGITLNKGKMFRSFRRDKISWENPGFLDVWIFEADFSADDVVLQQGETCGCKWASEKEILDMIDSGEFVPMKEFPYYKEFFTICAGTDSESNN